MNQFWKELRLAWLMGMVVPGVLLGVGVSLCDGNVPEEPVPMTLPAQTEPVHSSMEQRCIDVLTAGEQVVQMQMTEYLTGVILAEMPVSFEPEAQKAQAVVARTYTMRAEERGGRHDSAAVCTDSTCCQGYISAEDYLAKGGTEEGIARMRKAVEETEGMVLTYEGKLIEATYFSCSGGSTEDAVAVWGTEVPYLQAVPSPGEEYASHYTDTVTFTKTEFADALGLKLSGDPASWFGAVNLTAGGGVDSMVIGGASFGGTDLRKLLGLRSTAFSVTAGKDTITVTTRGYGHRVGMSQYGADAMAAGGSTFADILAHYYQGTALERRID